MMRSAILRCTIFLGVTLASCNLAAMSSNNPFDPLPFYNTQDPHEFLETTQRDRLRGIEPDIPHEKANITITPFWQQASSATNYFRKHVPLGDIYGQWSMLPLTYNPCPGTTFEPGDALYTASTSTFCGSDIVFADENAFTFTQASANVGPEFGFVSVPGKYRKVGARFEAAFLILEDIGLKLQIGVADVRQTVSAFNDQSAVNLPNVANFPANCAPDECCILQNLQTVNQVLTGTEAILGIADELGIDVSDYHKTGPEDFRGTIFWRHAFAFNQDDASWPKFLLVPFAQFIGCLAIAHKRNPLQQFSVSAGNNGHDSLGFNVGVALDFEGTVEISIEGGGTFFSKETVNKFRIPSDSLQQGFYPCTTSVCVQPGANWHFIATLHARRFLDKLSTHVQYFLVSHSQDTLTPADQTLCPEVTQTRPFTQWNFSGVNVALNYEISPNIAIGILWQAPFGRRLAPKTNTVLGSLIANF